MIDDRFADDDKRRIVKCQCAQINFAEIVKLPPDEELDDFIAFHVVDFYNRFVCPKDNQGLRKTLLWMPL